MRNPLLESQVDGSILASLRSKLKQVKDKTSFYKKKFENIDPANLSLENFADLPFTLPEDVRFEPENFLLNGLSNIDLILNSSGTTGKPKFTFHVKEESGELSEQERKMGINENDRALILHRWGNPLNIFTANRWRRAGLEVIQAPMQIEADLFGKIVEEAGITIIRSVPSTLIYLTEELKRTGFDFRKSRVKLIIISGTGLSLNLRRYIEENWGAEIYLKYSCNEVMKIAGECVNHDGLHINYGQVIVEILDVDSLQPAEPGQVGEVVLTNLRPDPMALVRYRVGDLAAYNLESCPCGLKTPRVTIAGRKDEMVTIGRKGTRIFPGQIADILKHYPGLSGRFNVALERNGSAESMNFVFEMLPEIHKDKVDETGLLAELNSMNKDVVEDLKDGFISMNTRLVPCGALEISASGKPALFTDLRENVN